MAKSTSLIGDVQVSGNKWRNPSTGGWESRVQAGPRGPRTGRSNPGDPGLMTPGMWSNGRFTPTGYVPPPGVLYSQPESPPPPNPGDFDPETGLRWMPGHGWQPVNMFSDLNRDYGLDRVSEKWRNPMTGGWEGGGGGGRGGGGGGGAVLPPGTVIDTPTGPITIAPRPPGNYDFLTLPESAVGFVPQTLRPQFGGAAENWMRGLGYTPQGVLGRYGETTYAPPAERADPWYFAPSLFEAVSDPAVKPWLQFLFGELGYTGRIPQPV